MKKVGENDEQLFSNITQGKKYENRTDFGKELRSGGIWFGAATYRKRLGKKQIAEGEEALAELEKTPRARFEDAPSLKTAEMQKSYDRAEYNSQIGYTPEEKAQLTNNLAGRRLSGFRAGLSGGAGGGQALVSAGAFGAGNDINQMAMSDAQLKRNNIAYADSLAKVMQQVNTQEKTLQLSQDNKNTGEDLRYRDKKETAYGQAVQDGHANVYGAYSDIGKTASNKAKFGLNFFGGKSGGGNGETVTSSMQNQGGGQATDSYYSQENYDTNTNTNQYPTA